MSYISKATALVEEKVEKFVSSNPQFQQSVREAFDQLDFTGSGDVSFLEAARGVDYVFDNLQESLNEFGITVRKPTSSEVKGFFDSAEKNSDGGMTLEEFTAFYISVLKFIAVECATGFTQKYGIGMLAGVVGIFVTKRLIRSIPVVGAVSAPFMALVPALLVGPLVGAAAIYSYDKRDWMAVPKLFPKRTAQFKSG